MVKEILGVDIGGTHLRFARIKNGKILDLIKIERPKGKEKTLKEIDEKVRRFLDKDIHGIGISFAGSIKNGVIKICPNLPFKGFNLENHFKKFNKPVRIENDANCAALAELKYGIKKNNFFVLTLGTGIGGGIIIDGKLYKGRGFGGELGHIIINNGKDFEYFAGTTAIKKLIKKYYRKKADHETVKKILHEKSSKAKKIRDEISEYIGQGIASLISIFDPEIVVLSGGLRKLGGPFLNKIRNKTKKYIYLEEMPPIVWSKIENTDLVGASLLFD